MKRIPTLAFLALLAASPLRAQLEANAPWPMFRHDVEHTGRSGYAGPSLPILSWSYTAEGAIHASPSIGFGGRAVAAFEGPPGGHATICAFVPDGSLRWSYATGSRWHHSSPAIGVGGEIVIGRGLQGAGHQIGRHARDGSPHGLDVNYRRPSGTAEGCTWAPATI